MNIFKKTIIVFSFFAAFLVFGKPLHAAYTVDQVFVDFDEVFIDAAETCPMPNEGFISICGSIRSTKVSGGSTGFVVEGATVAVYGEDKTNGNLTVLKEATFTNEDGRFVVGIETTQRSVYVAMFGTTLLDMYKIDATADFVSFDIALPIGVPKISGIEPPTDLAYVNRSGYLSCEEPDDPDYRPFYSENTSHTPTIGLTTGQVQGASAQNKGDTALDFESIIETVRGWIAMFGLSEEDV